MADPTIHPASILIVEDDPSHRELAEEILASGGYAVTAAADGLAALDYLSAHACDLVLSDVRMPDLDGMGLLQALEREGPHPPVIFMTAYASLDHTVDAVKAGAYGYITKPCTAKRLLHLVSRALGEARLRQENDLLRRELHAQWRCEDLIGRSPAMQSVFRMVGVAAETDGTVLVLGESGTGKELVARALHARSARRMAWATRSASEPLGGSADPATGASAGRCSGRMVGPSVRATARSITFSSSRTLPGQGWFKRRCRVSGAMARTDRRWRALARARK